MIRLLLLLCAVLFVTLQVGGQDRGQLRAGLREVESSPVQATIEPVQTAETAPVPAYAGAGIIPAVFAPAQPLITPAGQVEAVPASAEADVSPDAMIPAPAEADVRYVTGRSVNVRSGPSTQNGVVGRLTRGEAVSVVWVEDNGWARVRIEGDGIDGYMAMSFLADAAP